LDKNSALYWLPKIEATELPVPRTIIVPINGVTFYALVDGEAPKDLPLAELDAAARTFGYPVFVRSDITSAKHVEPEAAKVKSAEGFTHALYCIAEQHGMAMGMPDPRAILVREWLTIRGVIRRDDKDMGEEYRLFVEGGKVICQHPYWPQAPEVYQEGLADNEATFLTYAAQRAGKALEGAWSLDFAMVGKTAFLIDAARAGQSFHWEGCPNEHRWPYDLDFTKDTAV